MTKKRTKNKQYDYWQYPIDKIISETDKAWVIECDGVKFICPKSICKKNKDIMYIPQWLALKTIRLPKIKKDY